MSRVAARSAAWSPGWVVPAVATAAVVGIVAGSADGPVLCPLRRATGAWCPACGATRAAASLARGEVSSSWELHPMVVLVAVQVLVGAAVVVLTRGAAVRRLPRRAVAAVVAANAALALVVWAVRLATGAVPGPGG